MYLHGRHQMWVLNTQTYRHADTLHSKQLKKIECIQRFSHYQMQARIASQQNYNKTKQADTTVRKETSTKTKEMKGFSHAV